VYGPLTKTVADAALFMDQVVGPDAIDPYSLPYPGCSYVQRLSETTPALRIGFSPDLGYAVVQSDVAAAVEDAVQVFARLGHRVDRAAGGPPELGRAWGLLGAFLLGARLREDLVGRDDLVGRGLRCCHTAATMTQEQWAIRRHAGGLNAWCAEQFDWASISSSRRRCPSILPGAGAVSHRGRGTRAAVVQRRRSPSRSTCRGIPPPRCASVLPRRAAHGHADRRSAPPRRPAPRPPSRSSARSMALPLTW
jgi:hypothetical protein